MGGISGAQSARNPNCKLYKISSLFRPCKNLLLIARSRGPLYEGSTCARSTSPNASSTNYMFGTINGHRPGSAAPSLAFQMSLDICNFY